MAGDPVLGASVSCDSMLASRASALSPEAAAERRAGGVDALSEDADEDEDEDKNMGARKAAPLMATVASTGAHAHHGIRPLVPVRAAHADQSTAGE